MEYYTAIGRKKENPQGRFCVEANGEEYFLTNEEAYIWSTAIWAFAEKEELYGRTKQLLFTTFNGKKGEYSEREFAVYFQRLCTRGLLAAGRGSDYEGAAWEFLSRSKVGAAKMSLQERLSAFRYGMQYRIGFWKALRIFWKPKFKGMERSVMERMKNSGDVQQWRTDEWNMTAAEFLPVLLSLYEKKYVVILGAGRKEIY